MTRTEAENTVLHDAMRSLRHAGWMLDHVDLLEDQTEEIKKVETEREAIQWTLAVDESKIVMTKGSRNNMQRCSILVIRGNGVDVIADYGATQEAYEEVSRIIDEALEESHEKLSSAAE